VQLLASRWPGARVDSMASICGEGRLRTMRVGRILWRAFDKTVRRKPLAGCGGRGVGALQDYEITARFMPPG
jgi:hypothetical protein